MWIEGTRIQVVIKGGYQSTCIAGQLNSRRPAGAITPGFAMLKRAKRASHIDPPASSYAIMRRASPYRGETLDPARMLRESLNPGPELENSQGQKRTTDLTSRSRGRPLYTQKRISQRASPKVR